MTKPSPFRSLRVQDKVDKTSSLFMISYVMQEYNSTVRVKGFVKHNARLLRGLVKVRFDVVGDIAIIRSSTREAETLMAESILRNNHRLRVVLAQSGPVQGTFRLRELRQVAGEKRTTTVHRENGCILHVDLATMHFSPRLVHERRLVSESVGLGESVLNMFSGAGTFSIEIAQKNPSSTVYNVDINPDAIRMTLKNVLSNRLRGKVIAVLADAKEAAIEIFPNRSDRILLPLPEKSREYLDVAILALKRQGVIRYYDFVDAGKGEHPVRKGFEIIAPLINGKSVSFGSGRIVKSVAPRRYLVSLELQKRSAKSG
jgi:tRNA (guanine37-N1)-methyltransferase